MPVNHVCPHCQHRLAVPRRKIDIEFPCPRCGGSNFISRAEADARRAAARARRHAAQLAPHDSDIGIAYEDVPGLLGVVPTAAPPSAPAHSVPKLPFWSSPSGRISAGEVRDLLLVSRRMVGWQVMLFCAVAPVFFILGYLIGASGRQAPVEEPVAANMPG